MFSKNLSFIVSHFLIIFSALVLFFNCIPDDRPGLTATGGTGGTDFGSPGDNDRPSSVDKDTEERELVEENEDKWGESAMIEPSSINASTLEYFRLGQPTDKDDIDATAVYVDLRKTSNAGTYEGQVTLSYRIKETGEIIHPHFVSGEDKDARYNMWVKKGNTIFFHGFFQEKGRNPPPASVVLVLDHKSPNTNPDKPTNDVWGGSIWFMNFHLNPKLKTGCRNKDQPFIYSHPNPSMFAIDKKCWFIETGPLNCRTWKSGDKVDPFRRAEPDVCYSKFGTFEGLEVDEAFDVAGFYKLYMNTK